MNNVTNMGCMMFLLQFSHFTPRRLGEPVGEETCWLASAGRALLRLHL
jgi:hypothetical protein